METNFVAGEGIPEVFYLEDAISWQIVTQDIKNYRNLQIWLRVQ